MDYATDAYSELTANPDGTFTQDMSASPQRVQKNGSWVPLDATLHLNADGSYSTAATTARLTLSGGGTAPLAAMDDDGKQLAFSWPTALPSPSVTGSTALYTNVLPDVDLSVQANLQGGFSDTIIIKTAQAAQNPALSTLNLTTTTSGVTLTSDSAGNVSATDDNGTLIYHSPAPLMWDSSTGTTNSPSVKTMTQMAQLTAATTTAADSGPGTGAQVAPVAVDVTDDSLRLTPSASLLSSDTTTFPVYIDPDTTPTWVSGSKASADYTYIQSGHPDTSNWDANTTYDAQGIGVGYQGYDSPNGVERSFYQFNVGTWIDPDTIHSATLNVDETYTASFGCTAHDVKVYSMASHIDSSSTWTNFNGRTATYLDTESIGGAYNTGCAGAFHSAFNVTPSLSSDGDGVVTLELVGNESDRDQFKRFAKTATLSYQYNTIPNEPTGTAASPIPQNAPGDTTQGCNATGPWGWIPKNGSGGNITLSGKITDPDASHGQLVYGQFALWDDSTPGGATAIISLGVSPGPGYLNSNADENWQSSGSTAHKQVPVSNLVDGHLYGWLMRTNDGINVSTSTDACHFRYDASAPTGVSINNTGTTSGSCTDGGTLGAVGTADRITITATDSGSGVDHFDWTLGAASDLSNDGGTLLVNGFPLTLTPTSWGSYFLNVAAVDKAGNESGAVCYSFYVPDNPDAHVTPGDIDGDGLPDLAAVPAAGAYPSNPGLRYYATNALSPTGAIASNSTDGPNTDGTWTGALTAHRSTLERSATGTKTDDLWALGTNDLLRFYSNNTKTGIQNHANQYYSSDTRVSAVIRPACNTSLTTCTSYATSWASVSQLIAPGDMNNDGVPDLVTEEVGGQLWFFPGTQTPGQFGSPQEIGTTGWDGYTVIAPGETASTKGLAPIWARNNTTGLLYQYTPALDANGKITLTKTQIGSHYTMTDYPLIASVGDISGDGVPDLIATTASGSLVDQLGTATTSTTEFDGTAGLPGRIAASGWNQIQSIS